MKKTSAWEWSAEEICRFGYEVVDEITEQLMRLPPTPVFRPFPPDLAERYLNEPLPTEGPPPDQILAAFREDNPASPFGNGHPRRYGCVHCSPAATGLFAEALAAA